VGPFAFADDPRSVGFSPVDYTLKVWDLDGGHTLRSLEGHTALVSGVEVTADGKRAVSASGDHTLKVWDLDSGRELLVLEGHSASVYGAAVTPDGKRAVSASWDKTLKLWDLNSGTVLVTFTRDAAALCCAFVDKLRVIAGDAGGHLHFLVSFR
jgi:WD40 repeat protein